ncbi:hypothetical protein Ga0003345_0332 [Idiomarinaceae bacterium HL-53]|nr:hypothetical protein Ga0003345_0332 [Idiomarinaceae bacterium HL-53]
MPKKLLTCIVIIALSGCGSTPEPEATPTPVVEQPQEPVIETPPSGEEWLARAEATTSEYEAQYFLLQAATRFLDEDKAQQAGAILIYMNPQLLRPEELQQFRLQRARFHAALEDWQTVKLQLEDLIPRLSSEEDRVQGVELQYELAVAEERHFAAAEHLLTLQTLMPDEDFATQIWDHLRRVPADVWRGEPIAESTEAAGWYSLLKALTQALDRLENIRYALGGWQSAYPNHAGQTIVQEILDDPQLSNLAQRVAVLLPLSGQFATQGEAVRYGVLAALAQRGQADVRFIDTSQFNRDEINEQISQFDAELVVGPLDRAAVERVAGISERAWAQLALNHAPDNAPLDNTVYFALDLAAETQAAAYAMTANDHDNVLLLGPNNNRGRQLADLFTQHWQEQHASDSISRYFYSSSDEMRDVVRLAMGVQASEARQAQLERSFDNEDIEMEFRSRQDLDAIYLLGDATQARLLKPFIDVSISAFSRRIPVYGNSTINREAVTEGEADLDNVRFSDAPWLLPEHEQSDLYQEMLSVMSGWNRNQQRLTAMGYDSIRLAPRFNLMRLLPGYEYAGLTGQLRINDHTVVRTMTWATFDGSEIKLEPIGYVEQGSR